MVADADQPLTVFQRRQAMRLGYWNGAVWAIGNGLASTMLVIYLALELGAPQIGLAIAFIVAARDIVGLLRFTAPALIGRLVDRKHFCLGTYLLGSLLLLALPWVAAPKRLPSPGASVATLVGLWCVYHLLQYLGTIALWSWLADLVPLRIRGRFIGRRQRWIVMGETAAMLASGLFVWGWQETRPATPGWIAYAIPATLGACFMIGSLVPLLGIPRVADSPIVRHGATLRSMLVPFTDRRFLRLVFFGCWFALSTGLTQSAQYAYPEQVLGFGLFTMLALRTGMRCGQWTISPWMGRLADQVGNRPVMIVSLLLVAQGPLFYLLATPDRRWWLVGAWAVWIAYAGLNVCLPNLMLKLSPEESNTPYIAAYFTVTGLCYAANSVLGGILYDKCDDIHALIGGGDIGLDPYQVLFLLGWVARTLGVLVLLLVIEERNPVCAKHGPRDKEPR
jgi:MFS family permease